MKSTWIRDLRPLLQAWKYEEGKNIRRVSTSEGREVIQVRLPLGVEQYELHGRPDGERPAQMDSWYDYYRHQAEKAPHDFRLEEEAFSRIREECLLYYHRYLLFFQISEYKLCARDTRRNLEVIDFACRHAEPGLAETLAQYRPYIVRMHVISRALDRIERQSDARRAVELLEQGMRAIEEMPSIAGNWVFQLEKTRSMRSLRDLHRQLLAHLPRPRVDVLREELARAVEKEDYEEAARLRDEIAQVEGSRESP